MLLGLQFPRKVNEPFCKLCHLFRLSLILQFSAVVERLVRNGNANLIRLHKHTDIPEDRA